MNDARYFKHDDNARNDLKITQIRQKYGLKGEALEKATAQITASPEAWVDLMMRNEFNMTRENIRPLTGGFVTFVSFLLIGFIPLTAYTFKAFLPLDQAQMFIFTSIATLVALFFVGAVKSKFSMRHWFLFGKR